MPADELERRVLLSLSLSFANFALHSDSVRQFGDNYLLFPLVFVRRDVCSIIGIDARGRISTKSTAATFQDLYK